jgi:hypothetical protein
MKDIQYVRESKLGLTVSYIDDNGNLVKTIVMEDNAIEIIKTLGKALRKKSFLEAPKQ